MAAVAGVVETHGNAVHHTVAGFGYEPHRSVEGDRRLVGGRGDATHPGAPVHSGGGEEALVEAPAEAQAAELGVYADEVDVGLVGPSLRAQAQQES